MKTIHLFQKIIKLLYLLFVKFPHYFLIVQLTINIPTVCLGVCRKLFHLYFSSVKSFNVPCKLSKTDLTSLSDKIQQLSFFTPHEFQRRPRRLDKFLPYFKATEFRYFILYLGPYAFKNFLSERFYLHFLLLHFSIYVFCSNNLSHLHVLANNCLNFFVQQMPELFGSHSVSYNFHILLHIYEFVKRYGSLDNYSTFRFENFLGILKRRLKVNRYVFQHTLNQLDLMSSDCFMHKANDKKFHFTRHSPDNCAIICGHPCIVFDIDDTYVYGYKLIFRDNLYVKPFESKLLGIGYYSKSRSVVKGIPINKAVMFRINDDYLVIPYVS